MAQNASYHGRLVAAGCQASMQQSNMQAKMNSNTSGVAGEIVGDRTMKPADDPSAKPTRGYVDKMPYYTSEENANYPAAKSSRKSTTGDADRTADNTRMASVSQPLSDSCRLTSSTKSFALQLEDGRVIPLSRSSNAQVLKQLRTGAVSDLDAPIIVHGTMRRGVLSMQSMSL
jgi:hypothetical protein